MKQREEAARANDSGGYGDDDDYGEDDDEQEDWAGTEGTGWGNIRTADVEDVGGDIEDESQSYLDFLNEEVRYLCRHFHQDLLTCTRRRSLER
jgi:hypothetical protein